MMKKRWAQRNKKMRQAQIKWAAGNDYAEVNLLSTDYISSCRSAGNRRLSTDSRFRAYWFSL